MSSVQSNDLYDAEFQCVACFEEAPAEGELCASCLARVDRGELVECDECGDVFASGGSCMCGEARDD